MPTMGELLKAKKAAPVPFEDVDVLWDTDVSAQVEALEAQIEAAGEDDRLGVDNGVEELKAQITELRASADMVLTFRFRRMNGYDWAALCAKHPPRLDVSADLGVGGYNLDAVVREAVKVSGVRLDGENEETLTSEEWDETYTRLAGHDVKRIKDAVWLLNEFGPAQQLASAKKARSD